MTRVQPVPVNYKPESSIVIYVPKTMRPLVAVCLAASQAPRVADSVTLEKVVKP